MNNHSSQKGSMLTIAVVMILFFSLQVIASIMITSARLVNYKKSTAKIRDYYYDEAGLARAAYLIKTSATKPANDPYSFVYIDGVAPQSVSISLTYEDLTPTPVSGTYKVKATVNNHSISAIINKSGNISDWAYN